MIRRVWSPGRVRSSSTSGNASPPPGMSYAGLWTRTALEAADPALAARLLGVGVDALLDGADTGPTLGRDGSLLGALFESPVALSVRFWRRSGTQALPACEPYYYEPGDTKTPSGVCYGQRMRRRTAEPSASSEQAGSPAATTSAPRRWEQAGHPYGHKLTVLANQTREASFCRPRACTCCRPPGRSGRDRRPSRRRQSDRHMGDPFQLGYRRSDHCRER